MSRPDLVVVGGGLAGISSALLAADAGARVTLVESRARLGGATHSFVRDGLTIDNGQHVFLRCCDSYRWLLRRLRVEALTTLQPRLDVPVFMPSGRARIRRTRLPAPLHLAATLASYAPLSPMERLRAARAAWALRRVDPDDPGNDAVSFGTWLAAHRQSPAAVDALWDLVGVATMNAHAADASLALAAAVFRLGLLTDAAAGDIGYSLVPLQQLHGDPADTALGRAGCEVRPRHHVTAIERTRAGWTVRTHHGAVDTDAVVVAVPPTAASRLVPDQRIAAAARALRPAPIVNLHVVYDRPVLSAPFAAGLRSPVQWMFDRTPAAGLPAGQYLTVSLSAADPWIHRSVAALRAMFLPALAELLPAARTARVEFFRVTREPAATFRPLPGTKVLRPAQCGGLPGLAVAGAWTATGWPATMEGAVRSGVAAARAALADPIPCPTTPATDRRHQRRQR